MEKKILKQLKSDYEELEIKPSANLWDQIESGLDSASETVQKPSFQWWKYAAVVVLLISFGAFFYFENNVDDKKIITKTLPKHKIESANTINEISNSEVENLVKKEPRTIEFKADLAIKEENSNQKKSSIEKDIFEDNFVENHIKNDEVALKPVSIVKETDNSLPQNPTIAERKKVNYTNADQLLLGSELDKTREENQKNQQQDGVLDASKVKLIRPNSLQIFGFKVFSDSTEIE